MSDHMSRKWYKETYLPQRREVARQLAILRTRTYCDNKNYVIIKEHSDYFDVIDEFLDEKKVPFLFFSKEKHD